MDQSKNGLLIDDKDLKQSTQLILNYINNLKHINFKNKIAALSSNISGDYNIVRGYGNSAGDFDFMQISEQAFFRLTNGEFITWQK